jgi:hypothetical protein
VQPDSRELTNAEDDGSERCLTAVMDSHDYSTAESCLEQGAE